MQDAPKAVWHIPYVSVAFFPSLKHNFIAYRSSKESSRPDCIFEIHQLWQSGFSRVYSNCCCSCWFEREIITIGQSSHKMYSNNILTFQESTAILNACTKKSGNLLNTPLMCFNQTGDISTLKDSSLKLVDKFTYLGSSVSSIETDIDTRLAKAWTVNDSLSVVWKSDLIGKMKCSFFHAAVVSILLYRCTSRVYKKVWKPIECTTLLIQMGILLRCDCVATTEWVHIMDSDNQKKKINEN